MNIDIPNLVKAAVPESEGRNARIVSDNLTGSNHRDPNFLSRNFPRARPKLYVTAEDEDFDQITLSEWRDEGFDVEYLPMGNSADKYRGKLRSLSKKKLGPCETFGIIAYGDAAAVCLEHYHVMDNNPEFKLGLLIAYYPTAIPDPKGHFPSSISALVHLAAGEEIGITKQTQMVGIQGRRRTTRKKVEAGIGTGGTLRLAYPTYTYEAEPGFAEHDLDEFNKVPAELAWSRSLGAARKAFNNHVDLEVVLDENVQGKFFTRNLSQTMSTYTTHKSPHVTHMPTLTGGIGASELERFYSQFFSNPRSMKLTLISRTTGTDRVVDEVHVRFKHTEEMPWILPGVPATNKRVEVLVVSIVGLRGGKLYHEHVYWDQASVLVQIGLLDPKLVPDAARKNGVQRLPVVGREAARRVLKGWNPDEEGEADNGLIPGWNEDEEGDERDEEGVVENSEASKKKDSDNKSMPERPKPETKDSDGK
ncbi:dienelactone hydrolase [Colletotrichum graminicola]|uniref:Dienelactone hydrolase n=1 Tax=Colletotrichum graminicola (strain M1.001 / M2 / FGSC 10212) TaxID=645133 RepID=E3QXS0_COLGM|nr:dienelactone hydrolase [Colletotrichum graminicola M1.001]EFQ35621.1 dienelactone hydrolase [Colletotrichum graminicola M1.001]WDK18520.1 dienelactone hydrolase [Colletotrichum graminicola]